MQPDLSVVVFKLISFCASILQNLKWVRENGNLNLYKRMSYLDIRTRYPEESKALRRGDSIKH